MMHTKAPVILFDGVCNLCNYSVQLILKYERKPTFKFAFLQSETAKTILKNFDEGVITNSVLLIENGKLFQQSSAALRIAKHLKYFRLLYFLIVLPTWTRDPLYRYIARKRYKWFGKRSSCLMPTPEFKDRFI
jgi:predicted DCC family thiol-disulfide oxidoreductase YuxK